MGTPFLDGFFVGMLAVLLLQQAAHAFAPVVSFLVGRRRSSPASPASLTPATLKPSGELQALTAEARAANIRVQTALAMLRAQCLCPKCTAERERFRS